MRENVQISVKQGRMATVDHEFYENKLKKITKMLFRGWGFCQKFYSRSGVFEQKFFWSGRMVTSQIDTCIT